MLCASSQVGQEHPIEHLSVLGRISGDHLEHEKQHLLFIDQFLVSAEVVGIYGTFWFIPQSSKVQSI